jgi:hypothetical protein
VPNILFYDSTRPLLIPSGTHACLYGDGLFEAFPAQASRFAAVRWITVLGNYLKCGIADYEPGNEVFNPGVLRTWAKGRAAMNCRARVYCDRENLANAQVEVSGLTNVSFWISTLDGNTLSANYLPDMWGVQYAGGETANFDTSILYGEW